jgi:predicted metal-dependent enzyme (double-stranded beta helix superfamily)
VIERPVGRDLTRAELRGVARRLAAQTDVWSDLIRHDPGRRHYEELIRDRHLGAWLICWMDDHDTGFHDHDVSAGAVAVVAGAVREERFAVGGVTIDRTVAAGGDFDFGPDTIHRVRHTGTEPAVTLHLYSPPLWRMGAYLVDEDGSLRRRSISAAEELRPLENAA